MKSIFLGVTQFRSCLPSHNMTYITSRLLPQFTFEVYLEADIGAAYHIKKAVSAGPSSGTNDLSTDCNRESR